MLCFERVDPSAFPWEEIHASFADRTIFQAPAWMEFLKATQKGEPVGAALRDGNETVGYFTGMIVRRFGFKILGSPFPGWSTSYMGLNLRPGVDKCSALNALKKFAFRNLECAHLEFLDRKFASSELDKQALRWTPLDGFEVDLRRSEEEIFASFIPPCRQAIRRAIRLGVTVEETHDPGFVDDYHPQLVEVFGRQGLRPTYGADRVRELVRCIQPTGKLLLLRARDHVGRCIATGVFIVISPTTMYFWGGASWREYQNLRPNDLLMWRAMQAARDRGVTALDLGGAGDYKKKFGGCPISVPWIRVSSQPLVPVLRDLAKALYKLQQRLRFDGGCVGSITPDQHPSDSAA